MHLPLDIKAFFNRSWSSLFQLSSVCQICRAWPSESICSACIDRFAQPRQRCPTCALSLSSKFCLNCRENKIQLDACVAAVSYSFPWAECIARFKFQNNPGLSRSLAQLMRHAPWVEPTLENSNCIIPMPLSAKRLRERGFNQALELTRHLIQNIPYKKSNPYALMRRDNLTDNDLHQVGSTRSERLTSVKNTFWVPAEQQHLVYGQRVAVIDDVMTTGASLYEAARALRAAGASHVIGLVFARTESRQPLERQ